MWSIIWGNSCNPAAFVFQKEVYLLSIELYFFSVVFSIGFHFDKQFFRVMKGLFTLTDIESYDTEI